MSTFVAIANGIEINVHVIGEEQEAKPRIKSVDGYNEQYSARKEI